MPNSIKIGNFTPKNNIFLAPMAGITDMPFRYLCAKMCAGLTCTEMVSSKGMYYNDKKTKQLTVIHPQEKPCAVQIFGSKPEIMAIAAEELSSRGDVAIIDINMGCPAQKIIKNGEGCVLMGNEKLSSQIIKAVVKASTKPVTVKIRKGFDRNNAVEFAKMAEESGVSAITVHGRTWSQLYSGQCDKAIIAQVKRSVNIPVIGNGDVFTPEAAKEMLEVTGCDAIMAGRGAQGNPWLFKRIFHYIYNNELLPHPSNVEKLEVIKEHYEMMIVLKGEITAVKEMRKHLAWYIKGMPGASKLRTVIYGISDAKCVISLIEKYFSEVA